MYHYILVEGNMTLTLRNPFQGIEVVMKGVAHLNHFKVPALAT